MLGFLIRTVEAHALAKEAETDSDTAQTILAIGLFAAVSFGDTWLKVLAFQRLNVDVAATFNAATLSLIIDKGLRGKLCGSGARTADSIINVRRQQRSICTHSQLFLRRTTGLVLRLA